MTRTRMFEILRWLGVGASVAALMAFGYTTEVDRRQHAIRPEDGCLAFVPPPQISAIIDDQTDPLTGDQPRRWRANLDEEIGRLSPGAVLLVGAIGPAAPTEMKFIKSCIPLVGRGARASELHIKFENRLAQIQATLERSPSTSRSAISGTIAAAASDVAFLSKTTGPRRLIINSDLLENDAASAYRPSFVLPPLPAQSLRGVTVRFNILRNERDHSLQTKKLVETWVDWARAGGATAVEVDAPWLGFQEPLRAEVSQ